MLCAVTVNPINATVRACEAANFTCVGFGDFVNWELNGEAEDDPPNVGRGLVRTDVANGLNRSSTLTVPANNGNDNVAVECFVINILGNPTVDISPPAHLSVGGKIKCRSTG